MSCPVNSYLCYQNNLNLTIMTEKNQTTNIYDTSIRLLFLAFIVAWCLMLLLPFISILLWGVILAMAFSPLHNAITKWLGGRAKLSSTLIVIICLAIIFIPGWLLIDSVIEGVKGLKASFQAGTLSIPLPTEKVKGWPLIGERLYAAWAAASANIGLFVADHKEQIADFGEKFLKG